MIPFYTLFYIIYSIYESPYLIVKFRLLDNITYSISLEGFYSEIRPQILCNLKN
jgi:hypothetical protein